MKYKLQLTHSEYQSYRMMMEIFVAYVDKLGDDLESKLLICLLQSMFVRTCPSHQIVKTKYSFQIPMAEAMAFCIFWTGKPIANILSSIVVNKVIADIHRKISSL